VAVVPVQPPGLQDAVGIAVLARPAHVVHDFVPPVFQDRRADASADIGERLIPRHLPPLSRSSIAVAAQGIEDPVGILELVGGDDALRAGPAAAARVKRVALDLADGELFLVDVGQNAACRFAVETDAGNDPVVPAVLFRPARGFEIHVVVPRRGIRMRF
jgi:hypothetical protein